MRQMALFILNSILIFLIPTLFLGTSIAAANNYQECVTLEGHENTYNLDGSIMYYEDQTAKLPFQEILHDRSVSWTPLYETVPSFGFSSSAYWLKFNLCTSRPDKGKVVLEIKYPLLDSVRLFAIAGETVVYDVHTGDKIPFSLRSEKHRNFLFFLPDFSEENLHIFIRVQTDSSVQVPLKLYTLPGFFEQNQRALLAQGGYFGIIFAMTLYNAFLFFSLRELPYLFYVFFTISYFSFQGVLQGFFQQYIFDSVWLQGNALLIFGFLSILFANLFAISFLNLQNNKPILYRILQVIGWLSALAAFSAPMLPYVLMIKLMLALAIFSSLLIMSAGLTLWFIGHLPARIFTIAWLTLLISFVLVSLNKFGLLPNFFWTENIMQIGGVCEVLLLSLALGERINEEKHQRIKIEQSLSTSLEEKVQERTLSLNQALKQLETANTILDKMSLTDGLTQIGNRRSFDNQIEVEYRSATRGNYPLALIMIDIDHFKKVNDIHGHQAGDRVLQTIAETLRTFATRPRDNVFRYGGEEFAVVLSNTKLEGATIVADKMRQATEELRFEFDSGPCIVTISAGISVYSTTETGILARNLEVFIQQADRLLYQAKQNGRNRVETHYPNNSHAVA